MTDHAKVVDDRVESGLKYFLTGFFAPLGLGMVLAVVGFGLTHSGLIVLAGLANVAFLVAAANFLYGGYRHTEFVVWIGALVLFALAVTAVVVEENNASYFIASLLLMPAVFAVVLMMPTVRAFVAVQRGETLPPVEEIESLLVADAEGKSVSVRASDQKSALKYSRVLRGVAGLLILCALSGAGLGVVMLLGLAPEFLSSIYIDTKNTVAALTAIVAALLAMPLALVLMVLADNWYFLATTKGYEKGHLANIIEVTQVLVYCLLGAIPIVLLLAILDFFLWVDNS